MAIRRFSVATTLALLCCIALAPATALAGGDWNDDEIQWRSYEEGMAEAKKSDKPVCLVFFTEWCPHCTNYSGVFHDERIVRNAKQFVMIRIDKDRNASLSREYAVDGEYIPRTYFLSPEGKLDSSIHAPRDRFQYFYNEKDPADLLAGMKQALEKLNAKGG